MARANLGDDRGAIPDYEEALRLEPNAAWAGAARDQLAKARAQIARLRTLERELDKSLAYLELCESCEPVRVVAACKSCERHDCDTHAPVLVAGFSAN